MQCSCGSSRSKPVDSRKTIDRVVFSLNMMVCGSCGKVGSEALYRNNAFVASGYEARQQFTQLDDTADNSHASEPEAPANTDVVTSSNPTKGHPSVAHVTFPGPDPQRVLVNENHRKLIIVSRSSYSGVQVLEWLVVSYLYSDGSEAYIPHLQKHFSSSDPLESMILACRAIIEATGDLLNCSSTTLALSQTDASPGHPNLAINGRSVLAEGNTPAPAPTEAPAPAEISSPKLQKEKTPSNKNPSTAIDTGQLDLF